MNEKSEILVLKGKITELEGLNIKYKKALRKIVEYSMNSSIKPIILSRIAYEALRDE